MITRRKSKYEEIHNEPHCQTLSIEQDELVITGYKGHCLKKWVFYLLNLPLCGTVILLLEWCPGFLYLKYERCSLKNAENVLVKDGNGVHSIHQVHTVKLPKAQQMSCPFPLFKIENNIRFFTYKELRYIWLQEEMQFFQLRGWCDDKKVNDLLTKSEGHTVEEQAILLKIFGENEIKQRESIRKLAKNSAPNVVSVIRKNGRIDNISPFHLVPGDIIQIPQNGYIMPCDALLLCGNCIVNESTLTGESCPVIKTPATALDDVFNPVILKNHVLFCGTHVVQTRYYGEGVVTALTVNTGFSTVKGELVRCLLHPKIVDFKFYEDSIIFVFCLLLAAVCGIFYIVYVSIIRKVLFKTLVLDSLDLITTVVPPSLPAALSTGTAYSKSRLSGRGIFCISPAKINLFGKLKLMCFDKTGTLTEEGLDVCGVIPSRNGEFERKLECPRELETTHPLVVTFATCHTLTRVNGNISGDPLDLSMFNSLDWEFTEPGSDSCRFDLLCPTIVKPKRSKGYYKGNRVSSQIHSSLGPEDLETNDLPYEIGIVREFPFTSSSRCMSVITRELGSNHMNLYCKGAPEKIYCLCVPQSIPDNFFEQLQLHAAMGFRVLGLAYREFDKKFTWRKSQRIDRQEVEKDLIFLGFILLHNKLKPVSTGVVNDLREANVRCVMVTGDNLLTALSVCRECLMILPGEKVVEVKVTTSEEQNNAPKLSFQPLESISPSNLKVSNHLEESVAFEVHSSHRHYALDGRTWELLRTHFSDFIPSIIVKGTVFARMLPEQKTQLIQAFQELDYIVGMCGDGANDFGAMKAAHVGVSLSETENSVAAPFTSKTPDISCIISLIQEGRCALVSTFIIFKYMSIYGLIQFISVIVTYSKGVTFSNMQFLYVDFVVTSLLAIVLGRTGPAKILIKMRPFTRLISVNNLLPLALQVVVLFTVQILALEFLSEQHWFIPVVPDKELVVECWENTVIYCVGLFQFLILALVYSKATPYRQPFYKDVVFLIVFISLTLFAILLSVYPFRILAEFFGLRPVEDDKASQRIFRLQLLYLPLINLVLSFAIEMSTSDRKWLKKLIHYITTKNMPKNRYKRILLNSECKLD
ncbi:hypothetical protein RUM44_011923 [Polyplax serrata]|uniref:Cation-transporting ATPase n=1 Tax=Polyplax serrata TaxID=468196 RepID=A0ABR1BA83_POLSC